MSDHTVTVVEAQPDWLTCAVHNDEKRVNLRHDVDGWIERELSNGAKARPFRLMGYVGWQAGRVRWGERENAGLVQLSGDLAREHLDYLRPQWDHVSRFDVAVTARVPGGAKGLGEQAYADASAWWEAHPRSAVPSQKRDARGGTTVYLGERSSDYFARLYNKEAECQARGDEAGAEHYKDCWRYELECKGLAAAPLALDCHGSSDRPSWAQAFVHRYFAKHGMSPVFPDNGDRVLAGGFRRRSDYDTRLAWCERAVRPAIAWLLEHGDRDEVLRAIGLDALDS